MAGRGGGTGTSPPPGQGVWAERRRRQQPQPHHALAGPGPVAAPWRPRSAERPQRAARMESAPRRCPAGRPGCPRRWRWRRWALAAGLMGAAAALSLYVSLPEPAAARRAAASSRVGGDVNVLLWWEPFGRPRRMADCRRRYNITGCRLSADRSRYGEAHAVLFHHRDLALHGAEGLPRGPPPRPPRQLWVWMNFESPSHSPGLRGLAGLFNWTMTYRRDSDVFVPYGYLYAPPAPRPFVLPRKTRLVAWVISNWNEEHARVRYYRQLKEHLAIDVYGARGLALAEGGVVETVSAYKFYLAFENSQHTDYITEKLWRNAFAASAVPVVLGPRRANYERFIPADSFIHVDDFPSPRLLATYLKFLDKNKPNYRKYFAWRKKYEVHVTSFWDEHFCKVCEAVRTAGNQMKTVRNLAGWFES
ncbi:alpha-(1,3)-fucosyltransferase 4 [Dryobates pubescens]|uniref:alpha-(1,3)-fucosyltransferase 4 n=1 Tax=Dryobates pubescens TaxID=118200 RepID=UPI0023B8D562|nr:alpha-(1,3)-fucosyltransferase 4 [Dryobates pubescens]